MADINDLYAWTTSDASKVNLAMTVSPGDDGKRTFGSSVQYVFHVHSKANIAAQGIGSETQIICTFTSDTAVQCWVKDANGTKDYASGDPSSEAGLESQLGKFKVFAGRRTDPFFFNLQGFRNAVSTVKTRAATPPAITFDATDKCPNNLLDAEVDAVRGLLSGPPTNATAPCSTTEPDCFLALRVMAIVIQIDKALLNAAGNEIIGVWASTHMGS